MVFFHLLPINVCDNVVIKWYQYFHLEDKMDKHLLGQHSGAISN